MLDKKELVRWFKKGWAMSLLMAVLTFISTSFFGTSWAGFVDQIAANPTGAIGALIGLTIISMIWVIFIAPMVIGWLVEEVDKRIR